ncbi:hypothetical protein AB0B27_22110 [Micromonospora rifamycinica]|uniref:hypothetical protein n=1 Tax=Micromonospora rifamycinica TaxID=291594 RepID=UPI00340AA827
MSMSMPGKHTPKIVRAEVSVLWRRAGEVHASFYGDDRRITAVSMPPSTPGRPGLYRLSIALPASGRAIYIGEGTNVARRLLAYTRTYGQGKSTKKTEERLSREIRKALAENRQVVVDWTTTGQINLTGTERPLDMNRVSERRFAEMAAVLAEHEQDLDGNVILLNRILEEDWWLWEQ